MLCHISLVLVLDVQYVISLVQQENQLLRRSLVGTFVGTSAMGLNTDQMCMEISAENGKQVGIV